MSGVANLRLRGVCMLQLAMQARGRESYEISAVEPGCRGERWNVRTSYSRSPVAVRPCHIAAMEEVERLFEF